MPLVDQVAICLAGIEAAVVFDAPMHRLAGFGDNTRVRELLAGMTEEEALALRDDARTRARCRMLEHRDKAVRLVDRLLEAGKLNASEVIGLLASNAP